jgi:hypothetical protein
MADQPAAIIAAQINAVTRERDELRKMLDAHHTDLKPGEESQRDQLLAEVERLRALVNDHSLSAQQIVQRLRTRFDRQK